MERRGTAGWALWAWVLAGCAAGWPLPGPAPRILRVDAWALPGGDGSPGRPYRSLEEALAAASDGEVELQVSTGDYSGAVRLRPGLRIVGRGEVLLHADGGCVVRASGGELEGVVVQGGEVGLCAEGEVRVRGVTFSGQRAAALRVGPGARLTAGSLRVEATLPDITGAELQPGARARLDGARFEGPFLRAISSRGAEVEVIRSAFHDARTAVQVEGGRARLAELYAGGGRGPAVYVGQARAELEGVRTDGHEYGLLAGPGAQVAVRGLEARGAARAGVALQRAEGELQDVAVWNAGNLGGIQLTDSRVTVRRAEVKGAVFAGVQVLGGEVALRDVLIRHVQRESAGDGDGLVLHRGRVALDEVTVEGAEGSALVAGSGAEVDAGRFEARFVQGSAVFASGVASVRCRVVEASGVGEVVLAAAEGASVRVELLGVEDAVGATAWADCPGAARVCVGILEGSAATGSPGACVALGTTQHPGACR